MTIDLMIPRRAARGLAPLALAALVACSSTGGKPVQLGGADAGTAHGDIADLSKIRAELNQLEADPQLAPRAPLAIKEAEAAVSEAQGTQHDAERYAHLVYIADRKVQTARALAESKVAEDQLKDLQNR